MPRFALCWLALASCLLFGCAEQSETSDGPLELAETYLESASTRRAIIERALINHDNGYSALRLERYTEAQWGALPAWNPRVRPVLSEDIGAVLPATTDTWASLPLGDTPFEEEALEELGAKAFRRYPSQVEPALSLALESREALSRYGLWEHEGEVAGIVWVELPDGVQPAFTCATCHSTLSESGELLLGLSNPDFDYGQLLDDYYGRVGLTGHWGAGLVDVTPDEVDNPTRMADLRVARHQRHYNRAATLHADFEALLVRLETAVITNSGQAIRPPREMIVALSLYLWQLGETLPELGEGAGREVYDRECGSCHVPPSLAGPAVAVDEVGTDPTVGLSPWRTTGAYQTPSLRGLSQRRKLMANGAVPDLESLLDAERAAPGHAYGVELEAAEREALLELLRAL